MAYSKFYERFSELLRCIRTTTEAAYAPFGVGSTQAKFLRYIGANSHISQAQLARATMTAPTLTGRAIEALIERRWVRRRRSTEDRRQYVLELTPSGRSVCEKVEVARGHIIEKVLSAVDERDVADFDRIATKILAAFAR